MNVLSALKKVGKAYPVLIAAVVNIAIAQIAGPGLHVTPDQVALIVSVASAVIGVVTHKVVKKTTAPKAEQAS